MRLSATSNTLCRGCACTCCSQRRRCVPRVRRCKSQSHRALRQSQPKRDIMDRGQRRRPECRPRLSRCQRPWTAKRTTGLAERRLPGSSIDRLWNCVSSRLSRHPPCLTDPYRGNAKWPFSLSHNRLQTGGWARQQNGKNQPFIP